MPKRPHPNPPPQAGEGVGESSALISAIAHLTAELGADLGVVLSASHNDMPDNGIKFFARGGHKLDDAVDSVKDRLKG